jgi:hypothetical protein
LFSQAEAAGKIAGYKKLTAQEHYLIYRDFWQHTEIDDNGEKKLVPKPNQK